jgi:hypothetical protein
MKNSSTSTNHHPISLVPVDQLTPTERAVVRRWFGWARTAWFYQLKHLHRDVQLQLLKQSYHTRDELVAALRCGVYRRCEANASSSSRCDGNNSRNSSSRNIDINVTIGSQDSSGAAMNRSADKSDSSGSSSTNIESSGSRLRVEGLVASELAIEEFLEYYDAKHELHVSYCSFLIKIMSASSTYD